MTPCPLSQLTAEPVASSGSSQLAEEHVLVAAFRSWRDAQHGWHVLLFDFKGGTAIEELPRQSAVEEMRATSWSTSLRNVSGSDRVRRPFDGVSRSSIKVSPIQRHDRTR